jgi:putative membrane protein
MAEQWRRKIMRPIRLATATAAVLLLLVPRLAAAQAAKPNDAQIAHIAYTAGEIDIKAARAALKKSHNPQVRGFAEQMIRDHTAVNEKALALVKMLKVTPQDNPTSRSLLKQAGAESAKLAALRGPAFDRAYMQHEVAYHKTVDGALRDTLIPSASNPQLKDLLETALKMFEGHEQHAEQVAAGLK